MSAAEAETAVFEDKLRGSEGGDLRGTRPEAEGVDGAAGAGDRTGADGDRREGATSRSGRSSTAWLPRRTQIEGMSDELSARIMKAVLPPGVAGSEATQ